MKDFTKHACLDMYASQLNMSDEELIMWHCQNYKNERETLEIKYYMKTINDSSTSKLKLSFNSGSLQKKRMMCSPYLKF